tara:strand:+ start:675 stop:1007 length:333 start_codon:yes stop_codon:yes gene_type:complete
MSNEKNNTDIKHLETLKSRIEKLEQHHHIEILRIITESKVKLSENKSGVFINMSFLPDHLIKDIEKYLEYIDEQKTSLKTVEYQKEEFKKSFFDEKEDKDSTPISYNSII